MFFSLPFYFFYAPIWLCYKFFLFRIRQILKKYPESKEYLKEDLAILIQQNVKIKTNFFNDFLIILLKNYNYFDIKTNKISLKKLYILMSFQSKNWEKLKKVIEKNLGFKIEKINDFIEEEKAWWKVLNYSKISKNYLFLLKQFFFWNKALLNFFLVIFTYGAIALTILFFNNSNLNNQIQNTKENQYQEQNNDNLSDSKTQEITKIDENIKPENWKKEDLEEEVLWDKNTESQNNKWEKSKQIVHKKIQEIIEKFDDKGYIAFLIYLAFGFVTTILISSIFYRLFTKVIFLYIIWVILFMFYTFTTPYSYEVTHYTTLFAIGFGLSLYVFQLLLSAIPKSAPVAFGRLYYTYRFVALLFFIFSLVSFFVWLLYLSSTEWANSMFQVLNKILEFDIKPSENLKYNGFNLLYFASLITGILYYLIFYKIDLVVRGYFTKKEDTEAKKTFDEIMKLEDKNDILKYLIEKNINKQNLKNYTWKFLYNKAKIEKKQLEDLIYSSSIWETVELQPLIRQIIEFPVSIYTEKFNKLDFDRNIDLWFEREVDRSSISFLKEANKHEKIIHKENLNVKKSIVIWKPIYNEYEIFDSEKSKDYTLIINLDKILNEDYLAYIKSIVYKWNKKIMNLKRVFIFSSWCEILRFNFDWVYDFNEKIIELLKWFEYNYYNFSYPNYLKYKKSDIEKIDIILSYVYWICDFNIWEKTNLSEIINKIPPNFEIIYIWFEKNVSLKDAICL